jgi:membrane dipeptidase
LREEFGLTGGRGQGGGGRGGASAAGGAGAAGGAATGAPAPAVPPCPVEGALPAGGGRGAGRGGGGRGAAALEALSAERRAEYEKRMAEINTAWPAAGRANVKDFVNHIDYLVKLIGIDHVGISSDFDGGGGVDGWNSAAEAPNVTLELVRRGYTEEQIGKLWSGNLLRVWDEVAKVAGAIQAGKK